jgi:hypothetical protein
MIHQLEAYRIVYLAQRKEPGESQKVDNAIRAFADTSVPHASLTDSERQLLTSITNINGLTALRAKFNAVNQSNTASSLPVASTAAAGTAAAIAASGVASGTPTAPPQTQSQQVPQQTPQQAPQQISQPAASSHAPPAPAAAAPATPVAATSEPHKFTPNMTAASAPAVASLPPSHRPSVEPLTPVPGSPAVQNGTGTPLIKRSVTEITAADLAVKSEDKKVEEEKPVVKTE